MTSLVDHYSVLAVLPSADFVVIRAAYKALAQRYHPDRYVTSDESAKAHIRMLAINEAYRVLSDPALRSAYDNEFAAQGGSRFYSADDRELGLDESAKRDWETALKFYPELGVVDSRLRDLSCSLSASFRTYLLESKRFQQFSEIANSFEREFAETYFGRNAEIVSLAFDAIFSGRRDVAMALNRAVSVLGAECDAERVLRVVREDFPDYFFRTRSSPGSLSETAISALKAGGLI
ncbi:J domain-containing protein [Niveibacterium sp. 24ML]|uniref:J domain-containing protein n=1 Tax=Niveibacterium sp. 24ML TaxID=2985512 RepID=UPI00226E0A68|nr:J domain-containing protein [Niveibacterium sp. 24ML]MCX9155407.1 J domain-containing protein [Niveibacterium sp. 24ML]